MDEVADEEDPQAIEHHQPACLGEPRALTPEPGQCRLHVPGLQQPGVEQGQDRQDHRHMQQGAHQVVLVIEQGRGVQPDGPAPQEVAKAAGFGISLATAAQIEQVGDGARDQQENKAQAPVEIEQPRQTLPERGDQQSLQGVEEGVSLSMGSMPRACRSAAF